MARMSDVELPFNWTDDSATVPFAQYTNNATKPSDKVLLVAMCVVNGGTAIASTSGVVKVSTSNAEYTLTTPATVEANGVAVRENAFGRDATPPGGSIDCYCVTAAGSGKEAKLILTLQEEN